MSIRVTQADLELTEEISVYARISVDTEKESDENTSIENQLRIIHNHIKTHFPNCTYTEYVDRDESGYTFEQRTNYPTMRRALMSGKSKILIVKDFSRFSRRTSKGLVELEDFKDADVRIISIGDDVDFPYGDTDWSMIAMRFIMNEMPVTETSKKVLAAVKTMQESGDFLCAVPYGFVVTNYKKHLYEVVPDEAAVVKEIFRVYTEGGGYGAVRDYLNERKIPTPRQKEKERAEARGDEYKRKVGTKWNASSIKSILKNDFYIGTYRTHKTQRKSINSKDTAIDEKDQFVFYKRHESLVDDRTFLYAQELLQQRSVTHYRGVKKYPNTYTGKLFCGDCKQPMFSMSRSDLAPAYTCGTYHKDGKKGCTSHHTRVDFLDKVLKDYLLMVKENSADMIRELERKVTADESSVRDNADIIQSLENQLFKAKEELKATQIQKVRAISSNPTSAEIFEETYREIETDIVTRIEYIKQQLETHINKRNAIVKLALASKTVFQLFDNLINKQALDKIDIALIVDKIIVYENDIIKVQLKADIENLLKTGKLPNEEQIVNFNFDSIDSIFNAQYTHKVPKHADKVYTVNVLHEGDPLEIFTDRDGEVIFKKYSPIGELGEFASDYAESLAKTSGFPVCITDKDSIIAVSGASKKELSEKPISGDLEKIMDEKLLYVVNPSDSKQLYIAQGNDKYQLGVAVPIISEGDCLGSVVVASGEKGIPGEIETKLAQTAANFLGRHMES